MECFKSMKIQLEMNGISRSRGRSLVLSTRDVQRGPSFDDLKSIKPQRIAKRITCKGDHCHRLSRESDLTFSLKKLRMTSRTWKLV